MGIRRVLFAVAAVLCIGFLATGSKAEEAEKASVRERRSAPGYGDDQHDSYGDDHGYGYESQEYYKTKSCYQCAYSPPKTYYDKKVKVEAHQYGRRYGHEEDGDYNDSGYQGERHGGYIKKSYIPVPYTINGGWDKCLGPFDHNQAQRFGIDVWDCHSNCYVRKDPNGNIFRGCYKGEYGVDPYKLGCHYQAGAVYCFCEGDKCNNGTAPH